ncbi:MAG: hypothetical protein KGM96_14880 [Acidobacteriota bacterium]|nr:hypothetical protein [Acidobacteriota bacterium]
MRGVLRSIFLGFFVAFALAAASPVRAQQPPDTFRWIDFHSPKDQDVVVWVTRSLEAEKWTAIREIGVRYDAALVVTTLRATPQSAPNADTFAVWSVSLTNHAVTALLKGVNLHWSGWLRFAPGAPEEPGVLYDNCAECAATTYFTSFHYDVTQHAWTPRWLSGGQGIPVRSENPPDGLTWTQVFAVMAGDNGRELIATWNHFDYGAQKPAEDYLYQYDLDPWSGLDRIQLVNEKQVSAMKLRLCRAQDAVRGLALGQDSQLCQELVKPQTERRPVTTPPANNRGQSRPPGQRR